MAPEQNQDQVLVCTDCGTQFSFSARDQAFYRERGYSAPRRCRICRQKRKSGTFSSPLAAPGAPTPAPAPVQVAAPAIAPVAKPAPNGQPAVSGEGGAGRFQIVCSGCGQPSTVPFKPDPNRPVYCRSCYAVRRQSGRMQQPGAAPALPAAPPATS